MKNNITSTLVVLLCCCFIACLKSSLNLIIEINKQQTANSRWARTTVFLVHFLQKERANNKSVTLRPAALDFIIRRLILHSWRLRFLSQWASACVPRSERSFPAKLSNETSFNMDSISTCTRSLLNQKAHLGP